MTPKAERPDLAESYGISTDADGLMSWADVAARLAGARNYWIGTTRPDGRPHCVPVWGVWLDAALHFGTDATAVKSRNLRSGSPIVVHLESGDDAVMLEGRADRVTEPKVMDQIAEAYVAKYGIDVVGEQTGTDFWRVVATKGLAWGEATFPTTATRFTFSSSGDA